MKKTQKSIRRSKLEDRVETALNKSKISYEYEKDYLKYYLYYLPDFIINKSLFIEVKGYLRQGDPEKMIAVKRSNPDLDIRFIFQEPNKKLPRRKITHAQWADKHGFPYIGVTDFENTRKRNKWLTS